MTLNFNSKQLLLKQMCELSSVDFLLLGEADLQPGRLHRHSLRVSLEQILQFLLSTNQDFKFQIETPPLDPLFMLPLQNTGGTRRR